MVAQEGPPYAMAIILPQALALVVAAALVFYYLWRIQGTFNGSSTTMAAASGGRP